MKLVIDTDIGDDYDDVFTLAVALASPEIELLGVTTAVGDAALRARMARRLLDLAGRPEVPVAIGLETPTRATFSQRRWAEAGPALRGDEPDAVDFLLRQIAAQPDQITLLAIAPLSNLGAALTRDAKTFRKLGRIVLMGGSVYRGYRDPSWSEASGPTVEYNIARDIPAAQAVFASGVPLVVTPLDATLVALDEMKRQALFTRSTPMTDALALTYLQWTAQSGRSTPILFDTVALAQAIDPAMCRTEAMRLDVDAQGYTRIAKGEANAQVCLACDEARFFGWMMPRLMAR